MSRNFVSLLRVTCDRKLARRTKKRLTTACKTAHARHKKVEAVIREQFGINSDDATAKMERRREKRRRLRKRKRMEEKERKKRQEEAHDDDDEDDPFDDEHCTVEQFEQEAGRMRKKRMVDELDDDEREIRRLEAKLRKKKRGKGKNASWDGHSSDDDDLERAIFDNSSRSSD